MIYDQRAEAEIAVLTDVIVAVDAALAVAACEGRRPSDQRAHLVAIVLYELIDSARTVAGPDTGRLYAAPLLDHPLENAAPDLSPLDLLIPLLIDRHTS
ncbi:hypothetical protein [Nocardia arthritidis]|uniref:hypothetical protein n=1 Tax=Nocardia arthritidis TaxID=228602 RepID=UPI0007A43FF2|nr:hypothetical protein [Nocardia arthritidis]